MTPSSSLKPSHTDQNITEGPLSFEKIWYLFQEIDNSDEAVAYVTEDAAMEDKKGMNSFYSFISGVHFSSPIQSGSLVPPPQ